MTQKYGVRGQIQSFVNTVYEEAPFDFQRKYKQVRDLFYETSKNNILNETGKRKLLIGALNEALDVLPSDEIFGDVRELASQFRILMDYGLNSGKIGLAKLNEVSEEFWFFFCYYLRIHPKAHDNVGRDTIRYWTQILEDKREGFIDNFRDHALEFSVLLPEISKDEAIAHYVNEAVKEDKEFSELFSEFKGAVDGLDTFLSESKKEYRFSGLN